MEMLEKWTEVEDGSSTFDQSLYKIGEATSQERDTITDAMESYGMSLSGSLQYSSSYFAVKDVAKRLYAGTGSYGTPRYYILIEGESDSNTDDRILDIKLQVDPTPHLFAPNPIYDNFLHAADAHAEGYKALTANTDDHLGWMELSNGPPEGVYSVRERSPFKESFPTVKLDKNRSFISMAKTWGEIIATSHARADKDFKEGYVPFSFDKQVDVLTDGKHSQFRCFVRDVAKNYAAQVVEDYEAFKAAKLPLLSCP
mmetsp:Transcript_7635/g.13805  ORF Transcript_7635/g.13805 Transcript_7635/m.13805 type:complete len:256 (-) Transcript_7635:204-971(-)